MKEILTHMGTGCKTRAGDDRFLRPNINKVHKGEHSLRSFGPILWNNMLPDNLKHCTSLDNFKECIKTWTPEHCNCTLCKNYIDVGYVDLFE